MLFNRGTKIDIGFSKNNMLIKLIYINLLVFIAIKVLYLLFWLMQANSSPDQWALNWLAVPASLTSLILKPWTLFSYNFLHLGLWHLFSNMLWLYFLGQLFIEFIGEKKLLTLYIAGGLAGAVLYILFFNLFPVFRDVMPDSRALGASASVMAIVIAVGTYAPDFSIRLLFLGDVKLKYIAIFSFAIDVLSISNSNSGGHIAHIGGAALGFLFAKQWKKENDITAWVGTSIAFMQAIFRPSSKSKMKVKYKRNSKDFEHQSKKNQDQKVIDQILDKISNSGYDSLTKKEKDTLFKASNQN